MSATPKTDCQNQNGKKGEEVGDGNAVLIKQMLGMAACFGSQRSDESGECIFWISGLECKVCPTESRVTSKRWQVCRRISVDGGRDQKSEGLSIQLIVLPSLADGAAVTNRI